MEDELFPIYNNQGVWIGVDTRANAHSKGLWHEVVHVWVFDPKQSCIYLQRRSLDKKDFAGLYDITTAGHVDAYEEHRHGAIRECQEEIGLAMMDQQLHYLGDVKEAVFLRQFSDKEIAHVYVYIEENPQFHLGEEVDSLVYLPIQAFYQYACSESTSFLVKELEGKEVIRISSGMLCNHAKAYYRWLCESYESIVKASKDCYNND